jgi:uncharacterized membrane protein
MKNTNMFKLILGLSTAGIVLALYLLWEHYTGFPSVCTINSSINCDAIISGEVSKILNIPTPFYGLLGYIVILVGAIRRMKKVIMVTSTLGLIFCFSIAYIELFQLHVICPICILCQLIMLTVFICSLIIIRHKDLK